MAANLRYHGLKLAQAVDAVMAQLKASSGSSLPEALAKGLEAYKRQLTSVIFLAGTAMSPTFNPKQQPECVESLLVRLIPHPSAKTVFTGDVVAFQSPFAASAEPNLMVRRVEAVEGEELEAEDDPDEVVSVPKGHLWVMADNEALQPPHVIDSRSFGPLPFSSIVGRVTYAARSEADHGVVENSIEGLAADEPVLCAELDIERLCRGEEEGKEEQ